MPFSLGLSSGIIVASPRRRPWASEIRKKFIEPVSHVSQTMFRIESGRKIIVPDPELTNIHENIGEMRTEINELQIQLGRVSNELQSELTRLREVTQEIGKTISSDLGALRQIAQETGRTTLVNLSDIRDVAQGSAKQTASELSRIRESPSAPAVKIPVWLTGAVIILLILVLAPYAEPAMRAAGQIIERIVER